MKVNWCDHQINDQRITAFEDPEIFLTFSEAKTNSHLSAITNTCLIHRSGRSIEQRQINCIRKLPINLKSGKQIVTVRSA